MSRIDELQPGFSGTPQIPDQNRQTLAQLLMRLFGMGGAGGMGGGASGGFTQGFPTPPTGPGLDMSAPGMWGAGQDQTIVDSFTKPTPTPTPRPRQPGEPVGPDKTKMMPRPR